MTQEVMLGTTTGMRAAAGEAGGVGRRDLRGISLVSAAEQRQHAVDWLRVSQRRVEGLRIVSAAPGDKL
jgi:hypothetical protein